VYRFEPFEPTTDAIRRLVCGELDGALEWLGGADRPLDIRIHETRKHLKRLRALLQLSAAAIEPAAVREEMSAARAAAASLAELRGQAALLVAFDDLIERNQRELAPDALARLRSALSARAEASAVSESSIAEASAILTRARARSTRLPLVERHTGWDALAPGFQETYRRARRAYNRALARPTAERLHAFRTPAKRHLYQVELLERLWEGPLRSQRQELSRLGDLLGDHHDLSLLQCELQDRADLEGEADALRPVLRKRLEKLEREALSLGARAFAEKPGAITRRFGAYFRAPDE
jgi:CHAD domain-containing protein